MVNRGRRGGRGKSISAVRIVPNGEGMREQKVERQIAALKESQSTTRLQIKTTFFQGVETTDASGQYSWQDVRGSDEFSSLAVQFQKYRVVAFRFDVYDYNPSAPGLGIFGTYHGGPLSGSGQYTDLPDSGTVPPGTGVKSWYWYPNGPLEHSWYAVDDDVTDYGGLGYYVFGGTSAAKYSVIVSAIVDFRGRL